jgi:hypothetical protein
MKDSLDDIFMEDSLDDVEDSLVDPGLADPSSDMKLFQLAKQFATDHDNCQRTNASMSDYDFMINELVIAIKNTSLENATELIDGWVNMEDSDYCKDVQKEEVEEIMQNAGMLIDLQSADVDDDGGEEDDKEPAAPKVAASLDRLEEMAGILKECSIELDSFDGDFGDLAEELNDASNKVQSRMRLHKAKTLKKTKVVVAEKKFRQTNVRAFLGLTKKSTGEGDIN